MPQVLFKDTDMKKQGVKLMKVLDVAVGALDRMGKLTPVLQDLGRRHISYGVTAEMYPSVRKALLMTFEKALGNECTPKTKASWNWVLRTISRICIEAAKEVDPSYGDAEEEKEAEEVAPKTRSLLSRYDTHTLV